MAKDNQSNAKRNGTNEPQPHSNDQSGSAGRPTADPKNPGKDSGQGRYGQTGLAPTQPAETDGRKKYQDSDKNGDPRTRNESNRGSSHTDADGTSKDIPKTG